MKNLRRNLTPLLFLLPALIMLIAFVIYPFFYTTIGSFFSWKGRVLKEFVGLDNYFRVLGSKDIFNLSRVLSFKSPPYGAFLHNLIWVLIQVPLCTFLGLVLAVILKEVKGGVIIKSIIFIGMVIPMIVGGILLRFIYDAHAGVFNAILALLGFGNLTRTWTAYPDTALFALIIGSVWIWTGFSMVLYSAGLESIPQEIFEAAKIDGASGFQIFWKITIPMLKPITVVVLTMTVLWALKIFDIVFVATRGGPGGASSVLALEMYFKAFYSVPPDYGAAMVIATLLTILTLGFALYVFRMVVE